MWELDKDSTTDEVDASDPVKTVHWIKWHSTDGWFRAMPPLAVALQGAQWTVWPRTHATDDWCDMWRQATDAELERRHAEMAASRERNREHEAPDT